MRTTILASGDHHWFEDGPRFEECRRVHAFMAELAHERNVDLFLSAGDVYERASTPLEREAVAEWLTALAEQCPVVISKGNHDRHRDCALLGRLRTRYSVIVEEAARVHYVMGAAVAAMAWPERAALLAAVGSQGEADIAVRQCLQNVLRGLGDELEQHDGPRILLGHFMVDGSVVSTGQPLLGQPINVGLADLALARARLGVMGHIHKAQRFDVGGAPHFYTGSPFRTDFGQLEPKTVLLATFDGTELVEVEEIQTPAAPMVHLDARWAAEHVGLPGDVVVPAGLIEYWHDSEIQRGAEIRLRYATPTDRREATRSEALAIRDRLLAAGAVVVKVEEEVTTEKRARAPEVSRATSLVDKLDAHWQSIAFDPGERRASLLEKAGAIEEEDRHAA